MSARKSIFAGSWYPETASECEKEIKNFLKKKPVIKTNRNLTGGIVPHAGWYFSGSIACNVINLLQEEKSPDLFIIFGMHLHPGSVRYIMKKGSWETPFGEIKIEEELADEIAKRFTFKIETPENFIQDNTIELQLPFLKYFFKDVRIVPVGLPPVKESLETGRAIAKLSADLGLKTKVVGSTDLTHYGPNYGFMPEGTGRTAIDWVKKNNDQRIIDVILTMDSEAIIKEAREHNNACCSGAAAAAVETAKQLGARQAEIIAYATSCDIRPDDSFVGYAGIVF